MPNRCAAPLGRMLPPAAALRATIIPTPRQQGMDEPDGSTASPNGSWARWLKHVFAIDMARGPVCQQGRLWIIAAITAVRVMQKSCDT